MNLIFERSITNTLPIDRGRRPEKYVSQYIMHAFLCLLAGAKHSCSPLISTARSRLPPVLCLAGASENTEWTQAVGLPGTRLYAYEHLRTAARDSDEVKSLLLEHPPENVKDYTMGISAYARLKDWRKALSLLEDMRPAGIEPNEYSYSAAISACAKSGGEWKRALLLLDEMRAAGVNPSVVSFSAAISACAKGGQWQRALQLLRLPPLKQLKVR